MSAVELIQTYSGKLAVLLGGNSAEREISLRSGEAILQALARMNVDAVRIDPADANWLQTLKEKNISHVFIALHGRGGEDGTIQGALELNGIRYTGSGVMASALAMDKLRCKQLWRGIGLSTPDFALLSEQTDFGKIIGDWQEVMVKPSHEGSSIGMARVADEQALSDAFSQAQKLDSDVIAEQFIRGEEYTVAVLGRRALPAIRLQTPHHFYDYEAKYISNDTQYHCPCGLSENEEKVMAEIAVKAFSSIGCKAWARVDFMRNVSGDFFLLEVNTVPGMTDHSLVPMAAKAEGLSFDQLVAEIILHSFEPVS